MAYTFYNYIEWKYYFNVVYLGNSDTKGEKSTEKSSDKPTVSTVFS